MPRAPREPVTPEFLDMEIPKRRSRKIGEITQALVDMAVDPTTAAFFARPSDVSSKTFSGRIGSHIANAKRQNPRSRYTKRMVEFDGEDGICVWRIS